MKCLIPGEHFGANKQRLHLNDVIYSEAGYEPGISVPWHYHENAYFYFHLKGSLLEVNKRQRLVCKPGMVLFHSWQDPHYDTNFSKDARFYHIELSKKWLGKFNLNLQRVEGSTHLANPLFTSIFTSIYKEIKNTDAVTSLAVEGLLIQVYAEMIRYASRTNNGIPPWVIKVREILHEFDPETVNLSLLSRETGVHPVHICREFPKYFHCGFGTYVRKIRLQKALSMLSDPSKTITDIAYSCGYSDQSHFIRNFKQAYGVSPLQYRKSFQGRVNDHLLTG